MQDLNINVLELMASKICHDLISPIGAVNNGVEFLEEMGADAGEEVTQLIAFSALQASAKLRAYRLAFGAGGADTSIKPEEVHEIFSAYIGGDNKVTLDWDALAALGPSERPSGFCKILMCVLLMATEGLPKGGTITVGAEGDDVLISASGEDAGLKPLTVEALSGEMLADELEPKYVKPYITKLLSDRYKLPIQIGKNDDGILELYLKL